MTASHMNLKSLVPMKAAPVRGHTPVRDPAARQHEPGKTVTRDGESSLFYF